MNLFKKITNDEYVRAIEWTPKWDIGAPCPQVFTDGHRTFLFYLIDEPDPTFDGTNPTGIDNTSDTKYHLALITFNSQTFKFGIANDEVHSGLSLWGKGLKLYSAHIVENSKWIKELDDINKVHPRYTGEKGRDFKHYIFLFHDELLEVITRDFKVEIFRSTFKELAKVVIERMYQSSTNA